MGSKIQIHFSLLVYTSRFHSLAHIYYFNLLYRLQFPNFTKQVKSNFETFNYYFIGTTKKFTLEVCKFTVTCGCESTTSQSQPPQNLSNQMHPKIKYCVYMSINYMTEHDTMNQIPVKWS